MATKCVLWLLVALVPSLAGAQSTTIFYQPTRIDADTWQVSYLVKNDLLGVPIEEFTIFADLGTYSNLAVISSAADWNALVVQPDANLPDAGFFDGLATVAGIGTGEEVQGFVVQFDLPVVAIPGPQTYHVVDRTTLAILDQGVTVLADFAPPTITAPPDVTVEATGAETSVDIGEATADDNVGVTSLTNDAPLAFPVGTTTVTWTAEDAAGNTATATQLVTVEDTTPPDLTVPPDVTVKQTGELTSVDIGQATATDLVGPVTITNNAPAAGFPVGTTVVTWRAEDAAGNVAEGDQNVTVDAVPTAVPDENSTDEDTPVSGNVLINDDQGTAPATVSAFDTTSAAGGTVVMAPTGDYTYTPAANFNGTDSFAYAITDSNGDASAPAAVTIAVRPVNDLPFVANPVEDVVVAEDAADRVVELGGVFADVDIVTNGDLISLSVTNSAPELLTVSLSGTSLTLDFAANQNGSATIDVVGTDTGGLSAVDTFEVTVTPVNDAPNLSAAPDAQTVQYSDAIAAVTLTGTDIDSQTITLATGWTKNGGATQAGLPAGLSLGAASCDATASPLSCTWQISGKIQEGPGSYAISATATDDGEAGDATPATATTTVALEVVAEDARSTYAGPTLIFTPSERDGTATVGLRTTLEDITAVTADPATDPDAGEIRNATVTFKDETGTVLCAAPQVNLVFAGDTKIGSAACDWTTSLSSNEDARPVEVTIEVGNYYTDSSDNEVVIVVSKPTDGLITGGGYLVAANSAGIYSAAVGSKLNFGFNAKATQKGKNTQVKGRATLIVRGEDGRKYKFKSTAIDSLGIDLDPDGDGDPGNGPRAAQFEAKANLQDVTDPDNPISLGGNLLLQLRMTDNGEPGDSDTISWTIWNANGELLFSSSWTGSQTVEVRLDGGNLQVR